SGSVQDARDLEGEPGNVRLEDAPTVRDHLVGAFHRTDRRRQDGAAAVVVLLPGGEHWLLPDHAGALDLFDAAVAIGDDPVATHQAHALGALVGDGDVIREGVAA